MFDAAYVGLATVAGFIWWFVYADSGPKLPYTELVRYYRILVCGLCFWVLSKFFIDDNVWGDVTQYANSFVLYHEIKEIPNFNRYIQEKKLIRKWFKKI